jgi:hypothetical protein
MKSLAVAALVFASFSAQAHDQVLGTVSVPSSLNYGASFNSLESQTTFWDNYIFSMNGADANSVTVSINTANFLGLGDLSARLLVGDNRTTAASSTLALGSVLAENWGSSIILAPSLSQSTVLLNTTTLSSGTYTLQIRGTVTGAFGGSYAGVLNLSSPVTASNVPETDTYAMLIAGLGVMGLVSRRKSNKA